MRILVLVTGDYGWRHVENLRRHGPPAWVVETWETPKVLPPVVDYPEDYLPKTLPACDLILSLAEVKGVAEMLPEIVTMTGARAVIAPIDNTSWLPVGLGRQLREWLARMEVACVTPKPFCSLTEDHYNVLRHKIAYDAPLIREFARYFGRPAFRVQVDEATRQIVRMDTVRDACCGCARYVAAQLTGKPVDNVVEDGGLLHHHFPCQASMGIDPQYNDTLMHVSGNLMKDAINEAVAPYRIARYIRPVGFVEESKKAADSDEE
jgi:hypothetical protein